MSGKWSAEQHERFAATMAAKRDQAEAAGVTPPTRIRHGIDFDRCGALMPSGNTCRLPVNHPSTVTHRERLKGEYALAVVKQMTGIDLRATDNAPRERAEHRAAMDARGSVNPAPPPAPAPGGPDVLTLLADILTATATLGHQIAGIQEAVSGMRGTVLRVEDRMSLVASAAKITPVPVGEPPKWMGQLVEAFRTTNARLRALEARNVTSGDWEEQLDEILQAVRSMNRRMPEPRKKRDES